MSEGGRGTERARKGVNGKASRQTLLPLRRAAYGDNSTRGTIDHGREIEREGDGGTATEQSV